MNGANQASVCKLNAHEFLWVPCRRFEFLCFFGARLQLSVCQTSQLRLSNCWEMSASSPCFDICWAGFNEAYTRRNGHQGAQSLDIAVRVHLLPWQLTPPCQSQEDTANSLSSLCRIHVGLQTLLRASPQLPAFALFLQIGCKVVLAAQGVLMVWSKYLWKGLWGHLYQQEQQPCAILGRKGSNGLAVPASLPKKLSNARC